MVRSVVQAFIIGVALGDGNLSNPNGRAIRLRITCDNKYPVVIAEVAKSLMVLLPTNKVSYIKRKDNCTDISVYSNKLAELLPWQVNAGSKFEQQAHIPKWILLSDEYARACLRGLLLTDGSAYEDRGYKMVNFCTNIQPLAKDVMAIIKKLGYKPTMYCTKQPSGKDKYTVRLAKDVERFITHIDCSKITQA